MVQGWFLSKLEVHSGRCVLPITKKHSNQEILLHNQWGALIVGTVAVMWIISLHSGVWCDLECLSPQFSLVILFCVTRAVLVMNDLFTSDAPYLELPSTFQHPCELFKDERTFSYILSHSSYLLKTYSFPQFTSTAQWRRNWQHRIHRRKIWSKSKGRSYIKLNQVDQAGWF